MNDEGEDLFPSIGSTESPGEPSLEKCMSIDPDDLVGEMTRTPAELAYWNACFASAHDRWLRAKFHLEQVDAEVYLVVRSTAENRNVKPTEKTINSLVLRDPRYEAARLEYIGAEAEREKLNNICKTIAVKKDMLVAIGMRVNAELRADPLAAAQSRAGASHR